MAHVCEELLRAIKNNTEHYDVTSLLYSLTDNRTSRKFENCAMLIDSLGYYAVINYTTMDIYNNFRCKIDHVKNELVERKPSVCP